MLDHLLNHLRRFFGRHSPEAPSPDSPIHDPNAQETIAFGYKILWLAIRSQDMNAVAEALGLADQQSTSCGVGVVRAYAYEALDDRYVFVLPPVEGWTLVMGWGLAPTAEQTAGRTRLLEEMSRSFGEAQYYGSHRVSSAYAWAKAVEGNVVRAFIYADGDVETNHGELTTEERDLGLMFPPDWTPGDDDDEELAPDDWPDEEHVIQIAERWSVDPQTLDERIVGGQMGIGGRMVDR